VPGHCSPMRASRPAYGRSVSATRPCATPCNRSRGRPEVRGVPQRLQTVTPQVTCSIGVASWDFQESARELFERADQALYAAKAAGRNRSVAA
jgi:GGDEF domain-containing protein